MQVLGWSDFLTSFPGTQALIWEWGFVRSLHGAQISHWHENEYEAIASRYVYVKTCLSFLLPLPQNDMFDLLLELRTSPDRFAHMVPGEWYKSWQLVWSEVNEKCSTDAPPYNPCEEFAS